MPLILPSNSISAGGYEVDNSLRFDDGSSDYLNKTLSSGNTQKWTISFWIKKMIGSGALLSVGTSGNYDQIYFNANKFAYYSATGGSDDFFIYSEQVFRDSSAWYHIVLSVDTTQATASNRVKLYVNGEQVTTFDASNVYPSQNFNGRINSASQHNIGNRIYDSAFYFSGHMAEVCFVDGQQLDPTSFGEFDEDTGIWKPIDVSGLTFGTNGFYLDFENSGSLGADVSGNGNNFTVNNLTSIDQTTDTCTNNFATGNSLLKNPSNTLTFSEGNLKIVTDASSRQNGFSTIGVTTGKWYGEFKLSSDADNKAMIGIANGSGASETSRNNSFLGTETATVSFYNSGTKYIDGSSSSYGNSYASGNIIGIALDLDNSAVYFSINGTFQNSGDPTSGASKTGAISFTKGDDFWFMGFGDGSTSGAGVTWEANFGNPAFTISSGNSDGNGYGNFEYSVPSGYYALNTKNLAEFG